MATRRPKVPSAHFSAGAKKVSADSGTTPDPAQDAHAASHGARQQGGPGKAPRQAVTDPRSGRTAGSRGSGRSAGNNSAGNAGRKSAGASDPDADTGSTPVPARTFNGRLLVLGLAMAAVTVALAPNVHTFMGQRAEISALQESIAAQTAQQSAAQSELARWDDPAYVKQQARDRVSMLMPGETGYWVYGAKAATSADSAAASAKAAAGESADKATAVTSEPWVDSLWQAVEKSAAVKPAVEPAAKAASKPAAK